MSEPITLEKIIRKFPERFNAEQGKGLQAVFQFLLNDSEAFHLVIKDEACVSEYGEHPDPDITLIMDESTFMQVISGELDGMSAFMKGQLRAEGNVMLATRLGKLFSRSQ
ncbi:SCP2 sterol-binding domain-containing protein [Nitrincola alkalilacustris]|uniref:SCP2 sterol-binding domain-containing protein n=1 Tax=Nitrincola alkalilacustris TaxID=1571224 RepID=UPI00124E266D|nr:SCP2 sterol-binding domain-containing protein [Nitrincola alkalilacustris]